MADEKPAVAFIGLGAMGFGMATHLLKQGYAVTGFDAYEPTLQRFQNAGGLTATTPSKTVANKSFCVCMVATAEQAQAVLLDGPDAAVNAMPQGTALLLCSTVPCQYVQSLGQQLVSIGRGDILLVDSPVSGGAARAADGTLSIMAGMSEAALAKARPLLAEMADPEKLYIVQGGVGAGSNMKMVHQVLAACQILAASEAMGFASRLGLALGTAQRAVLESEAWNWMFEHRTPRMLNNFQPVASAVNIIVKDTSIITAEGRRNDFPTPMTATAEQVYFTAIGRGYGQDDDSSLIRLYTSDVQLPPVGGLVETEEQKLALVIDLLKGILFCAAREALSFANIVDLDLDQVLDLCNNAAGGSTMLMKWGPDLIRTLYRDSEFKGWAVEANEHLLEDMAGRLQAAIETAQRLKVPLFLGHQALDILRRTLRDRSSSRSVPIIMAKED